MPLGNSFSRTVLSTLIFVIGIVIGYFLKSINSDQNRKVEIYERLIQIDDKLIDNCKTSFMETLECDANPNCDWEKESIRFRQVTNESISLDDEKKMLKNLLE